MVLVQNKFLEIQYDKKVLFKNTHTMKYTFFIKVNNVVFFIVSVVHTVPQTYCIRHQKSKNNYNRQTSKLKFSINCPENRIQKAAITFKYKPCNSHSGFWIIMLHAFSLFLSLAHSSTQTFTHKHSIKPINSAWDSILTQITRHCLMSTQNYYITEEHNVYVFQHKSLYK